MSVKATVVAPSNIAFIKYWGTKDLERTLPFNPSLSMTLKACATRTTIEVLESDEFDRVTIRSMAGGLEPAPKAFAAGVTEHLDRLRDWAGIDDRFRVATHNTFPMGAGIASSASGFAALALAFVASLGRQVSAETASCLARHSGSGSAARSVMGGYVEWPGRVADEDVAVQVLPPQHWDLRDVIAILDTEEKKVSSRAGHKLAETSPYFRPRLELLPERLQQIRRALHERDFDQLAPVVEEEAIDLHLIAMSSRPPVFYWLPGSLTVLELARELRATGVEVCATLDAGANVHLICTAGAEAQVAEAVEGLSVVQSVIRDGVGKGPEQIQSHLF